MAARYVVKRSSGQYMFNLKAPQGETILTSERYATKQGAEKGIVSVRANCPSESRYEKRKSTNGSPYFVLKAANGEIIGTSEMYSSEAARNSGIEAVKNHGLTLRVDDET